MTITEILKGWFIVNMNYLTKLKQQRKISQQKTIPVDELYQRVHQESTPIFVLSTGRCGTKLLTELLQLSSETIVAHSPTPEPTWHANWAYHHSKQNIELVKSAIDAMRYEHIRDAYLLNKQYIETNNRITFFAPALAQLYPKAKFIHLYRHPEKFVASGLGRKWYQGVSTDEGRLVPSNPESINWSSITNASKISWLWNETNMFIEEFKELVSEDRLLTVKAEDLFQDINIAKIIIDYCHINEIEIGKIKKSLSSPINAQPKNKRKQLTIKELENSTTYTTLLNNYYPDI